jgi:[ribosomal protein S5]-alanine N-acetyltransferase
MRRQPARIIIRPPQAADEAMFLTAVRRSKGLHGAWVKPPSSPQKFRAYLAKSAESAHCGFVVVECQTAALVGVINLSHIIRGPLQNAFIGYYVFKGFEGRGLMAAGMKLVMQYSFIQLRLHRLEANIQPANFRSIRLVQHSGFQREGLARRYLKIGGRWQDHEHWVLLREEFNLSRQRC